MRIVRLSFFTFAIFLTLKLTWLEWSWGFIVIPAAVFVGAVFREHEIEAATGQQLSGV